MKLLYLLNSFSWSKRLFSIASVFFIILFLSNCSTTAMYTSPVLIHAKQNIYNFTIETGGYSGETEANERVVIEIQKFMDEHGYKRFKILSRTNGLSFPGISRFSGFKYLVQLYK